MGLSKKIIIKKKINKGGDKKKIITENKQVQKKKRVVTKKIVPINKINSTPTINIKNKKISKYRTDSPNSKRYKKENARAKIKTKKPAHVPVYHQYPPYERPLDVDFDVAICISSYDRYGKVKRLLNQLYKQDSFYTYKVFLLNDGSHGTSYGRFKKMYPDLVYLRNEENGGKYNYWQTVTKLWSSVKDYSTYALCQLDDDFIICNNFIDRIMDKFFELKRIDNGYMALRLHNLVFNNREFVYHGERQGVDGGTLYDTQFMEMINYSVDKTIVKNDNDSSNVWVNTTYKIREHGIRVFNFKSSLVYHDGNEDSKLNPSIRRLKKMNTVKFIDHE